MARTLLKKTSTTKTRQSISAYVSQYLDETAEQHGARRGVSPEFSAAQRSGGPGRVAAATSARLQEGQDYFTRVEKGQIHAFGFIAGLMQIHSGRRLGDMDNAARADAARLVWNSARGHRQKTAHNLVFGIHPDFVRELMEAKVPADEELLRLVGTSLDRFQKRFYPNDRLGYLVGIHHDHQHLHAHVLMFPWTEKGVELNMTYSAPEPDPMGGTRRIQYQQYIKDQFDDLARALHTTRVAQNPRMEPLAAEVQSRLLSQYVGDLANHEVTAERAKGQQITEADGWTRTLEKRWTLLRSGEDAIRRALDAAYEQRLINFSKMTKAQAGREIGETLERIKGVRASLHKALGRGNAWEGARGLWKARQQLVSDVRAFKSLVYRWGRRTCGQPNFRSWSEREWFEKRAQAGDDLGRFMAETHGQFSRSLMQREIVSYLSTPIRHATRQIARDLMESRLHLLNQLQGSMLEKLKGHREKVAQAREHEDLRMRQCRIMLHHLEMDLADQRAAMAGRKPKYLQEYEAWRLHGVPIPVALAEVRLLDAEEQVGRESAVAWNRARVEPLEPPPPDPDPIKESAQPERLLGPAELRERLAQTQRDRVRAMLGGDGAALGNVIRTPSSRAVPRNPVSPGIANPADPTEDLAGVEI